MTNRPIITSKQNIKPPKLSAKRSEILENKPSLKDRMTAQFLGGFLVVIAGILLYSWRLDSLTMDKSSPAELATRRHLLVNSLSTISLNEPYYLLLRLINTISHSLNSYRLLSVALGVLTSLLIYWLVSNWHGYKIALLTVICSISSFGFLIVGRSATPIIFQLLLMTSLVFSLQQIEKRPTAYSLYYLILTLGLCIYLPGGIWLSLIGAILSLPKLPTIWRVVHIWLKVLAGVFSLALISPAIYLFSRHYSIALVKHWLGINIYNASQLGHNLIDSLANLFIKNNTLGSTDSLSHSALVPFAISLLFLIGAVYYAQHLSTYRWRNIFVLLIASLIISSFGELSIFILLPLIFISLGTGLAYLLKDWYRIFPRNPFARNSAVAFMGIIILFIGFYSLRSYFVAWANDPASMSSYSRQLK